MRRLLTKMDLAKLSFLNSGIRAFWLIAILLSCAYILSTNGQQLAAALREFSALIIILIIPIEFVRRFIGAHIFYYLLPTFGSQNVDRREAIRVEFVSNASGLIPGGIWKILSVLHLASSVKLKKRRALYLIAATFILQASAAALISGFFLTSIFDISISMLLTALIACTMLGYLLFVLFKNNLPAQYQQLHAIIHFKELSVAFLHCVVVNLMAGVIFYLFISSTALDTTENVFFYVSLYSFAWLTGYVSFFAPAGLGVREVVLLWGLNSTQNLELAMILLLLRLISIVPDLLLVYLYRKGKINE